MVMNETKFDLGGYIQIQVATIISGLRWTLTQLLLKNAQLGLDNPLSTMMMIAPPIALFLLIGGSFQEGLGNFIIAIQERGTFGLLAAIFGGSMLAFFMILIEFELVRSTSAVTLSVAGIFKEILTITFSVIVFQDRFTVNMFFGLVISLVGIAGNSMINGKPTTTFALLINMKTIILDITNWNCRILKSIY